MCHCSRQLAVRSGRMCYSCPPTISQLHVQHWCNICLTINCKRISNNKCWSISTFRNNSTILNLTITKLLMTVKFHHKAYLTTMYNVQDTTRKKYLLPWKCREQKRQACAKFSSSRSFCCWSKTSLCSQQHMQNVNILLYDNKSYLQFFIPGKCSWSNRQPRFCAHIYTVCGMRQTKYFFLICRSILDSGCMMNQG